jgi:cytochrome o ubiquinol oxidase subunit IV
MSQAHIDSSGASHGSFKSYITGFILSIVLTLVPFALVMSEVVASHQVILFGISGAAIAQVLVHLHYFLHLDTSSANRWNVLVLLFTLLIMIIIIGGTLVVIYNLNYRMM